MACHVLIVRETRDCDDPDNGMSWRRGLPVDVLPYFRTLGRKEDPQMSPDFFELVISDMDRDEVHPDLTTGYEEPELIRAYEILVDDLPLRFRRVLEETGRVEMAYGELHGYVRHRVTGDLW